MSHNCNIESKVAPEPHKTTTKYQKYIELISLLHPKSRLLAKETSRVIRISGTDRHYVK